MRIRKTLFIIFFLTSICCIASGQEKTIQKTIEKETYMFRITDYSTTVWNANNKYWYKDSNYNPKAGLMPMPKTTLVNREGLKQLLHTTLKPYLKPELLVFGKNFSITLFVNLDGSIKGVAYDYPAKLELPVSVIREIEQYILKNCSVDIVYNAVLDGALFLTHWEDFILKEVYNNTMF